MESSSNYLSPWGIVVIMIFYIDVKVVLTHQNSCLYSDLGHYVRNENEGNLLLWMYSKLV